MHLFRLQHLFFKHVPVIRRLRFSMRALLIVTAIIAICLATHVIRQKRHYSAIRMLQNKGAFFWDSWEDPIGPNFIWARDISIIGTTPTNGFCKRIGLGSGFVDSPFCTTGYFACTIQGEQFKVDDLKLLSKLLHVERLDISDVTVAPRDLMYLKEIKSLKYLGLDIPKLTDEHISSLEHLNHLETLHLIKGAASHKAIAKLRKSLVGCNIKIE